MKSISIKKFKLNFPNLVQVQVKTYKSKRKIERKNIKTSRICVHP